MNHNAKDPSDSPSKFGTFGGVFTPCVLTILGVIMFLRFGEVVGNAGLIYAVLIVLSAKIITLITGLSLSAIATNTRTEGGGAYFLISRSLGVEFGGTIGTVFFMAQAISVAMYVIGFAEALVHTFPGLGVSLVTAGTVTNLAVFACVMIGAGWTIKVQYLILGVLIASLVSFGIGAAGAFSTDHFQANLRPDFAIGQSWVTMFALFFPAVTGIMAGANMSGDLKDPAKSIPTGTLAAIAVTAVIYLGLGLLLAGVSPRADLMGKGMVMSRVAVVPWLIIAGVFAATLSSALGSMMGSPRILQAFARDRVLPILRPFAKAGEPRRATVLTFLIAQGCILLGDLNAIAPIITMAFMITYGTLNLATFYESFTRNPSYRPQFRWCHWTVALTGAILCFGVMFLISWAWALIAIAGMAGLYWLISQREIEANWGDLRSGLAFERARKNLAVLEDHLYHPKNWRPMLLTLSGAGASRRHLAVYGHWLTAGHGIQTLGQVIEGELPEMLERRAKQRDVMRAFIRDQELSAFPAVVVDHSVREGIISLVQAHGLGGLEPNTVLLGPPENPDRWPEFCGMIRAISGLERSLLVVHSADEDEAIWSPPEGTIDVWWRGQRNGPLMLLLAHLLTKNHGWRNRAIRLLRVVPNESAREEVQKHLADLIRKSRIHAEPRVFVSEEPVNTIRRTSASAAVVILGFDPPADEPADRAFQDTLERFSSTLPRVLFVYSAGGVALDT